MSRAILVIGQSHVAAIRAAAKIRREADPDRPRTRTIHTLEPHYAPELVDTGEGAIFAGPLDLAIRDQIGRHDPLVASASGGNVHNAIALVRHPRPYDFRLSFEDDRPLDPDAEPITEALVRAALEAALDRDRLRLAAIQHSAGSFIQIESPPPIRDEAYIAARAERYFRDRGVDMLGVAPAALRYRIWRLHSQIIAAHCARLGIGFLPAPRETQDRDGFLRLEYAGDATHGNERYGEAVIRMLEAL